MGVFFQIMGASVLPVAIFTAIWGVVGVLLPVLVPRSPHKSVIQVPIQKFAFFQHLFQVCLIITAACCWLFWLCCYMSQVISLFPSSYFQFSLNYLFLFVQMNPLIGPILETKALYAMKLQWDGGADD